MTQIQKFVALSAAILGVALCPSSQAQDDLDNLLKDLESEASGKETKAPAAAKPVEVKPVEAAAEKPAEAEAKESPAAKTAPAEKPAEPVAEAKPVEPKATVTLAVEKPAEKAAEPAPEAKAEVAVEEKKEEKAAESAPAAKAEEAVAETKTEEKPAEEAKSETKVEEKVVAETKPAAEEKPAAQEIAKSAGPDAELISNLATTEKIRRQALDAQAKREIEEARSCMKHAEYDEAVRHYEIAQEFLNDREAMKNLRKECKTGIAEGYYRAALQENDLGRRTAALEKMNKALDRRHPKARRVLEKWASEGTVKEEKVDLSEITHRKNEEDYKAQRDLIRRHLRRSRQYLGLRDMKKALEECELVLVNDPYNQEAIRIRAAIEKKRQVIREQERKAARDGMIADVDEAWRPAYNVNDTKLGTAQAETVKTQTGDDPERTMEQEIEKRMKEMRLPNISFKPPATIIDAVEFFRQASRDYDRPDIPAEKRGFNFVLRTPPGAIKTQGAAKEDKSDDFTANESDESAAPTNGLEPIQTITASDISFYEAMKLVCDSVGYKFIVSGQVVMVMPQDMSTAELIARKYNVPEAFVERVASASEEMKTMGGAFGGNNNKKKEAEADEGEGQDWKGFFEEMGVKWPEGSSIKHIKALGKLYVRNTRENLAEFEKVLDELGGQPQLIEIETRFVEVSQADLNSLGFEWLLNSDYSFGQGGGALKKAIFGTYDSTTTTSTDKSTTTASTLSGTTTKTVTSGSGTTTTTYNQSLSTKPYSSGSDWIKNSNGKAIGVNSFGGTSDYANGNRYLSTEGNSISGSSNSTNDQFMRVNAFLGNADLSMILHMLSQRTDTDLLSAPKVVTKSGENAVIKVVTEYIYPQDYDVQLSQSSGSSSSSSSSSGNSSMSIAIVEPQNFTMREVGVILDVTPTYSEANGGTIDLELKPQVVDEPTWKNYGMKIPITGNPTTAPGTGWISDLGTDVMESFSKAVKNLVDANSDEIASQYVSGGINSMKSSSLEYYDAPMEQPFFHVRSIDSKVAITPGSTVVMGGLITEARTAMDDKIPFLGDLPYIGRLFRSHAEQTTKRNLLIFVTGRLITPSGRELKMNEQSTEDATVKPAPKAE